MTVAPHRHDAVLGAVTLRRSGCLARHGAQTAGHPAAAVLEVGRSWPYPPDDDVDGAVDATLEMLA